MQSEILISKIKMLKKLDTYNAQRHIYLYTIFYNNDGSAGFCQFRIAF